GAACLPCKLRAASVLQLDEVGPCRSSAPNQERRHDEQAPNQGSQRSRVTTLRHMVLAYVGLGSNLGDREGTLRAAIGRLKHLPETKVLRVSTLRRTDPVGYVDQPRFLNGAVELETGLSARRLLGALL